MALEIPSLDDKRYSTIVEEARKRIPLYTDRWSDHNVHDPGITFLELLSWIAEMQAYHLDQITEKHYLKYLRILGFYPEHQRSATVDLTFTLPEDKEAKVIPKGEKIFTNDASGAELVFETSRETVITKANIKKIISDYLTGREDNTEANAAPGMYFLGFGTRAKKGSCMYVGFENFPFPSAADTLDIVIRTYEENLPPRGSHGDEDMHGESSVRVVWEYCVDYEKWYRGDSWKDFDVIEDTTEELCRTGVVVLKKPPGGIRQGKLFGREEYAQYYWIRCRIVKGRYDVPPQLETVLINTVQAVHRETIEKEPLVRLDALDFDENTSSGMPNQRFGFKNRPVINATITVGGIEWKKVPDFDGSGPQDRHYVLNRAEGIITFGDGIRGKIPEAGYKVRAERYAYGGGEIGNVMPNSPWRFRNQEFKEVCIENFVRASGGREEESLDSALDRLRRDLKVPYRAVTLDDYRYIATHTPGLRFGRAEAVVYRSGEEVEGCEGFYKVKVVVVPFGLTDRPEPTPEFLDAVCRHLDRHRLLTTQIEVTGPKYVGIGVRAQVKIKPGYSEKGRRREIQEAMRDFLHPLRGGEEGDGWPFGRTVYKSEIYEIIEGVEGVDCVLTVYLEATGDVRGVDEKGNILLYDDSLVYSTEHRITIVERDERCRGG